MNVFIVCGIAFGLAMDVFAVSAGISLNLRGTTQRQTLRLALHFGLFQFMMPILGWLAGLGILVYIQAFDHWVAFGLLVFIGGKMLYESFGKGRRDDKKSTDPTKGLSLFLLSFATSIDALAVGLSLAAIQVAILYPAVIIGLVAFLMTVLGTKIGPAAGQIAGKRAEFLGGVILILIGIKVLADHL